MYRRSRRPTSNRSDRSRSADAVKVAGPTCQPLGFSRTILPWHWEVVMQRKRVWRVRAKLLALMWCVPLTGSTCSPSEPGCEFGEACGEPTEKVRSCINFCAPIYPEPVVGPAVLCALDQCDEETISQPEVWRCPNVDGQAYACVPSDATPDPHRIGVCRPSGGFLDRCDPGDSTSCKSGAVCLNAECPEASERHRLGVPPDVSAYCWFPLRRVSPAIATKGEAQPVAGRANGGLGAWRRHNTVRSVSALARTLTPPGLRAPSSAPAQARRKAVWSGISEAFSTNRRRTTPSSSAGSGPSQTGGAAYQTASLARTTRVRSAVTV